MFWPRLAIEIARKTAIALAALSRLAYQGVKISRDQDRLKYMDQALSRASDDDADSLELLTQTASAKQSAAHQKKIFDLTHGVG